MLRSWIVAFLALSLLPLAQAEETPAAPPSPLAAEPLERDAGEVVEGAVLRYTFTLMNRGQETLKLKVNSNCGCTIGRLDPEIAPGGRATLEALLNTKKLSGKVSKIIAVRGDPGGATVLLRVKATVRPLVRVEPARAAFVIVKDRGPNEVAFTLTPEPGRGIEFTEAVSSDPHFLPRLVPAEGEAKKLIVAVTPDAPPGHLQTTIAVATTSPITPRIDLIITGEKGIAVSPRMVFWGNLPPDGLFAREEILLVKRGGRFTIRKVRCEDPAVKTRVETVTEGERYRIVVNYTGGWKPGRIRTHLTIETDDRVQPTITIPVQAEVIAKG